MLPHNKWMTCHCGIHWCRISNKLEKQLWPGRLGIGFTSHRTQVCDLEGALPFLQSESFPLDDTMIALEKNIYIVCGRSSKGHTLLLQLILEDLFIACPHRQFHTLPGLLERRAALSNSYPNTGSLYHFYNDLWYDPAGERLRYLPHRRGTC